MGAKPILTNKNNVMSTNSFLLRRIKYEGIVMTTEKFLKILIADGYNPNVATIPKYEYNRTKYNRMDGKEQQEYEEKLKQTKTEYRAIKDGIIIPLSKQEYDYLLVGCSNVSKVC